MSDSWQKNKQSIDPVYRTSLREGIMILSLWLGVFLYTVTYCYLNGYLSHEPHPNSVGPAIGSMVGSLELYDRDPDSLMMPLGLGIPDWVFYGVVIPWILAILASIAFYLFFFVEDDLRVPKDLICSREKEHD